MGKWEIKTPADYAAAMKGIQDKLDKVVEGVNSTTSQAVADVALDCLGHAVERAPVEIGTLRSTAYAEVNQKTIAMGNKDGSVSTLGGPGEPVGNEIVAEIGFPERYATVQHEHVEFNHPMGGQAKFLESVVVENGPKWGKHLASAARKGLRGDET